MVLLQFYSNFLNLEIKKFSYNSGFFLNLQSYQLNIFSTSQLINFSFFNKKYLKRPKR